jgi:hypothetical protein
MSIVDGDYFANLPKSSMLLPRNILVSIACFFISLIYLNAMFFRLDGVNMLLYAGIVVAIGFYYLSSSARSFYLLFPVPLFALGLLDILLAYIIFFTLKHKDQVSRPLERDHDIAILIILGSMVIGFTLLTEGVNFDPRYGFFGRIDIGFFHPNWAPVWGILLAYYCKYYRSPIQYRFSLFIVAVIVIFSGSLGKIPLLLFLIFSGFLLKFKKVVYYGTILVVVGVSIFLLTDLSYQNSILTSGRNVIFNQLLQTFSAERLFLPVNRADLSNSHAIGAWYGGFNVKFEGTVPLDNFMAAAVGAGPLSVFLFLIFCGGFKCPTNRKDFDRKMLFWLIGLASNPLSMWMPFMLFIVKTSGTRKQE